MVYTNASDSSPRSVTEKLRRLSAANTRYGAALARRLGFGFTEAVALQHLALAGAEGLSARGLGERLSVTSGAVTALADRLERAGHLERRPNREDRRSLVLMLTPSGRREAARHVAPLTEELDEAAAKLAPEERALVGRFLDAVVEITERRSRAGGGANGG
ncbi:MarR family winged helix-turn-helix transcriptional regulator [Rubrobacter marinus]|uniref:MarR family winged helix-turn-helix transcriptional regulator n=1 Tax=Rubrobacter marinus TaxID=2653852 RepID=UPI00140A599A|nr:MarR family transcriptional regulator [Rubrobacter marinus]